MNPGLFKMLPTNNSFTNHIYLIRGEFNKFPDFFVQAFKIVVDSWKFTMLWLYILWDDGPIFRISASNEHLQQQLEYTLIKPDYQLVNFKNAIWTWGHFRRTICNKILFKTWKKCLLFDHFAWIEHQFLSGIRDSRKASSLWGMMRGVGGVRKSIHQSW